MQGRRRGDRLAGEQAESCSGGTGVAGVTQETQALRRATLFQLDDPGMVSKEETRAPNAVPRSGFAAGALQRLGPPSSAGSGSVRVQGPPLWPVQTPRWFRCDGSGAE